MVQAMIWDITESGMSPYFSGVQNEGTWTMSDGGSVPAASGSPGLSSPCGQHGLLIGLRALCCWSPALQGLPSCYSCLRTTDMSCLATDIEMEVGRKQGNEHRGSVCLQSKISEFLKFTDLPQRRRLFPGHLTPWPQLPTILLVSLLVSLAVGPLP